MTTQYLSALRHNDAMAVRVRIPDTPVSRPLRVAFLIDVSDSMQHGRLDASKRTLHALRDLFQPDDRITIVCFGDVASCPVENLAMDADGIRTLYERVDAITTNGCTNLSAGLILLQTLRLELDAVVLLTDGDVNAGITSTVGLRRMTISVSGQGTPIYCLGYGEDHNRALLKDLALQTFGTYTYVSSDEIMPYALGDMVAGLRAEVLRNALVRVETAGWVSIEIMEGALGAIVSGRDYWVVFRRSTGALTEEPHIVLTAANGFRETLEFVPVEDSLDLREQVLRARIARAMADGAERLEYGLTIGPEIIALNAELEALPDELRLRPLITTMAAQLAEVASTRPSSSRHNRHAVAATLSSGATRFAIQRGVNSHDTIVFSSPAQRNTSQRVYDDYTGGGGGGLLSVTPVDDLEDN